MTLQGFNKESGEQTDWVAVPLELVDWMAAKFGSPFTTYLASLDPYNSEKVAADQPAIAVDELTQILNVLRTERCDVPEIVDLFGQYGLRGAKKTVTEMIQFFQAAITNNWKVVSIGD